MKKALLIFALLMYCRVFASCDYVQQSSKADDPEQTSVAEKPTPIKPQANVVKGRVTMEDGSPLRGNIKDISIGLRGVTEVGKNTSFSPIVKADGTYSQKVPYGFFSFSTYDSYVSMIYNGREFKLPLEPVGNEWSKRRESTAGIVQDFVLKITGPTPYGETYGLKISDATHWYGQSIGLLYAGYRNDLNKSSFKIQAETKLTFTLTPTGPSIDGLDVQTYTVDRVYQDPYTSIDLNDLVPTPYNLSGIATLPDGTTKPLLFEVKYSVYDRVIAVPLEPYDNLLNINKRIVSFVIDAP